MMKKKGTRKSNLWQHRELLLVFVAWIDNNIFKSLSTFHSPVIAPNGVQQQIKIDKVRQRKPVGIPVPLQQKNNFKKFNLIDKGHGAETKYDIGGNTYI